MDENCNKEQPMCSLVDFELSNYFIDVAPIMLSMVKDPTLDFLREVEDQINWNLLSIFCNLTSEIIEEFWDKLDHAALKEYQDIEFLDEIFNKKEQNEN